MLSISGVTQGFHLCGIVMVLMGARASKTSTMEVEIVCSKVSIGLIGGELACNAPLSSPSGDVLVTSARGWSLQPTCKLCLVDV